MRSVSPVILKRMLAITGADAFADDAAHRRGTVGNAREFERVSTKQKWPRIREDLTREEQIEVIIQINGRLRGKMLVDDGLSEEETQERALNDPQDCAADRGEGNREDNCGAREIGEYRFEVSCFIAGKNRTRARTRRPNDT